MNDKQKTFQIEIHLIIDRLQNGLIHPMTAKKLLYESANKALIIPDVIVCSNCKFNGMQPMNDSPCDMYNASEQTCSNYNKL
jgi:hypothetical protein